jgi:hypothetical protein
MISRLSGGVPEGEVRRAVEPALGSDVLAQQEIRDGSLVVRVGGMDAVPAQMRCRARTGHGRQRCRQVHKLPIHHPRMPARHLPVEVVLTSPHLHKTLPISNLIIKLVTNYRTRSAGLAENNSKIECQNCRKSFFSIFFLTLWKNKYW